MLYLWPCFFAIATLLTAIGRQPLAEMKLIQYNPLSAATLDRQEQIAHELPNADLIALIGTAQRTAPGDRDITQIKLTDRYSRISWGWAPSRYVNKSAGITFLIKHSLATAVRQVLRPPDELRGRLAGIRIRNTTKDLLVLAAYIPPRGTPPTTRKQQQTSSTGFTNNF